MGNEELTLATICDGAVNEKVNRALQKVFANILDPNTDPKKKREVNLKIILAPNPDDPEDISAEAVITTKTAPEMGLKTQFYLEKDLSSGAISAVEHAKGQIKGQLSFKDMGTPVQRNPTPEFDAETGEIKGDIIDFRRKA